MGIVLSHYFEAMAQIPIFSSLEKDELKHLLSSPQRELKEYGKGQIIYLKYDKCNTMDIILEGKIAIQSIDENGNILTIKIFSNRDVIGANLVFSGRNEYPMTATSLTRSTILHLPKQLVLEICKGNELFMNSLLKEISNKTLILTDKINEIIMKSIRQRIVDFLDYEFHQQGSKTIRLRTTKKELAERLGIQRASLSRELSKMKRNGLIDYDVKSITIKNMPFIKNSNV